MLRLTVIYNIHGHNSKEAALWRRDKFSPEVFLKQCNLLASPVMSIMALWLTARIENG